MNLTVIPRKNLNVRIHANKRAIAYWLEAPTGFGKTSLLNQLMQDTQHPLLFSLAPEQLNAMNLVNFLNDNSCIELAPSLHDAKQLDRSQLRSLVSQFYQQTPCTLLVIEDYTYPQDNALNTLIHLLVENCPQSMKLMISGRHAPPSLLQRFIVNQQLQHLNQYDLAFDQKECGELLTKSGIKDKRLHKQCFLSSKGWPAYISMFATHKQKRTQTSLTNPVLCQALVEYFRHECLASLDDEDFFAIAAMAHISHFSIELVASLCHRNTEDMLAILSPLIDGEHFIYADEEHRFLFHFHPAIKQSLLHSSYAQKSRLLFTSNTFCNEYIESVLDNAETLHQKNLHNVLAEWICILPSTMIDQNQWLNYWHSLFIATQRPSEARERLQILFNTLKQNGEYNTALTIWANIAECYIIDLNDMQTAHYWIKELILLENNIDHYPSLAVEAHVLIGLHGILQWVTPHGYDVPQLLQRTERTLYELQDPVVKVRLAASYIRHLTLQGSYFRAIAVMSELNHPVDHLDLSPRDNVLLHYARLVGKILCGTAITTEHIELNDAQKTAKLNNINVLDLSIRYFSVFNYLLNNNIDKANVKITDAQKTLATGNLLDQAHLHFALGWLELLTFNYEKATRYQLKSLQFAQSSSEISCIYPLTHLCIINSEQSLFDQCEPYFDALKELGFDKHIGFARINYYYVKAYHAYKKNCHDDLHRYTTRFLEYARSNAIYDLLCRVERVMSVLFEFAIEHNIEATFTRKMIAFQNAKPQIYGNISRAWPHSIKICVLGDIDIDAQLESRVSSKTPSKIEMRLLKLLISNNGKPMSIRLIEEIIWPGQDTLVAGSNFKSTASRVRKRLGNKDAIIVSDNKASLNKRLVWVDAWGMSEGLKTLERGGYNVTKKELFRFIEAFTKLYQGSLVIDIDTEAWLSQYAIQLQEKYIAFIQQASEKLSTLSEGSEYNIWITVLQKQLKWVFEQHELLLIQSGNHHLIDANQKQQIRKLGNTSA